MHSQRQAASSSNKPGHALRSARSFRARSFVARVDDGLQRHETFAKSREERMMTDQADRCERVVSRSACAFAAGAVVGLACRLLAGLGLRRIRIVNGTRAARETPVEVHADAEALPVGILLGEGEDEGRDLPEGRALVAGVDAAFGLTEEDDVGRQGEVFVVFERIATEQLGRLRDMVELVRMPATDDDHIID